MNALGGQPLLCLHKDLDPTLTRALEEEIVPALEQLGTLPRRAPDLRTGEATDPALTLVLDREGWSPAVCKRLAKRGIAMITWHKGFDRSDWLEDLFETVRVPYHRPAGTKQISVLLTEQDINLAGGLNGRQVPLMTTDFHRPTGADCRCAVLTMGTGKCLEEPQA